MHKPDTFILITGPTEMASRVLRERQREEREADAVAAGIQAERQRQARVSAASAKVWPLQRAAAVQEIYSGSRQTSLLP